MMTHRARSRTVDSTDGKKPRRLTEKIAIMKKREHEQLEAFEHAMKSIYEMQRARIHSGGGSMPSLQAIDSTPPSQSIDMQVVLQDYNEVTQGSNSKDRPQSSGPSRGQPPITKATSMDTEPYPTPGHSEKYWNIHKSDSDLHQSLLMQLPHSSPISPQHHYPLSPGSPQQQPRNHKLNSPPADLGFWRRTNSTSTTHALLSPDSYLTNHDAPMSSPLGMSAASTGTASSSLPDLTNIEFSSGLDVPLERDEPHTHPPAQLGNPLNVLTIQRQQQQQQQNHQPLVCSNNAFYSPPAVNPGPSKLLYTSLLPLLPPSRPGCISRNSSSVHPSTVPSLSPRYATGFQFPVLHGNVGPGSNQPGVEMRHVSPLAAFHSVQPAQQPHRQSITKSPTMPEFQTLRSPPTCLPPTSHEYPTAPRLKPILPNSLPGTPYRPQVLGGGGVDCRLMVADPLNQRASQRAGILPPMTIIIQPPRSVDQGINTLARVSGNKQQISNSAHTPSPASPMINSPSGNLASPPQFNNIMESTIPDSPPKPMPAPFPNNSDSIGAGGGGGIAVLGSGGASLPSKPAITVCPSLLGHSPFLPSYVEAKQQQALQERFASINVGKNEAMIRSHSEENLQKIQKDKGELIQQNPFMGTLTNANSVPCVYVESQCIEQQQNGPESPPNLDSPSTSASYASSPPSVRPFWMELNEYVFNEWPLQSGGALGGGGAGGPMAYRPGSPPHHHRSLTDLIQNTIPELGELSPSNKGKAQQLSLPSVAMTDLTMEEQLDKGPESLSEFFMPNMADFEMDESVMELIKNDVPDLNSFEVSHMISSEAGILAQSSSFFSSSPDSYFRYK